MPSTAPPTPTIFAFATKGTGTNEERRLRRLLGDHQAVFLPYDKGAKARSLRELVAAIRAGRPDLLVMEGTGLAGGLACLWARIRYGQRYVVSSGDAVGPFIGGYTPWLRPAFALYERLLCRLAAGFIGWTPYLVGRALTFGCPRAMTAAGWSEQSRPSPGARQRVRESLGIPTDAIVFGLVGSLEWVPQPRYCYGLELVRAAVALGDARPDIRVLVVGDGSGSTHLRAAAGDRLGRTVLLPGAVAASEVVDYMAAMDVGSLPQSVDGVGSFRYTTKISEYLAAGLPIVTGHIPLAYDLDDGGGWMWRLEGSAPWTAEYISALRRLMLTMTAAELNAARGRVPSALDVFNADRQVRAVTAFVADLIDCADSAATPAGLGSASG
jgi:hypothetical protein